MFTFEDAAKQFFNDKFKKNNSVVATFRSNVVSSLSVTPVVPSFSTTQSSIQAVVRDTRQSIWSLGTESKPSSSKVEKFLVDSVRSSTRISYKRYWDKYLEFCKQHKVKITSESVSSFLIELAEKSGGKGAALIAKSAIKFYFKIAFPKKKCPTDSWLSGRIAKTIVKKYSRPVKKANCLSSAMVKKLVLHLLSGQCSLKNQRSACFFLMQFIVFGRYEELSSLLISDVTFLASGDIELVIEKAKNFEAWDSRKSFIARNENKSFDPVAIIRGYIRSLKNISRDDGLLFPAIEVRNKKFLALKKPVSYGASLKCLRDALSAIGYDGMKFSLHSPRTGGLSEAANSGKCSMESLRRHGRWSSCKMPDYYHKQSLEKLLSVSKSLSLYD